MSSLNNFYGVYIQVVVMPGSAKVVNYGWSGVIEVRYVL